MQLTADDRTVIVKGAGVSKVLLRGGGEAGDVTQPHVFTLRTLASPGNHTSSPVTIAFPGHKAAKAKVFKWEAELPWQEVTPNSGKHLVRI